MEYSRDFWFSNQMRLLRDRNGDSFALILNLNISEKKLFILINYKRNYKQLCKSCRYEFDGS